MRSNNDDDDSGGSGVGRRRVDNGVPYKPRSPAARSIANLGVGSATLADLCCETSRVFDTLEGDALAMTALKLRKEIREQIDVLSDTDRALGALIG